MGKVYAVKVGFDKFKAEKIENKLYTSWADCSRVVLGVKGAQYKSFPTEEDAKTYLYGSGKMELKGEGKYPKGCNHSYVDGSFDARTDRFGYGALVTLNDVIIKIFYGSGPNTGQRQISGELTGAKKCAHFAKERGDKQLVIFHDYFGVGKHATGEWNRNSAEAEGYYRLMQRLTNDMEVTYVKVAAHTGDLFNEVADDLAKYDLGIASTNVVARALANGETLKAGTEEVYNFLIKIYDHRYIVKVY